MAWVFTWKVNRNRQTKCVRHCIILKRLGMNFRHVSCSFSCPLRECRGSDIPGRCPSRCGVWEREAAGWEVAENFSKLRENDRFPCRNVIRRLQHRGLSVRRHRLAFQNNARNECTTVSKFWERISKPVQDLAHEHFIQPNQWACEKFPKNSFVIPVNGESVLDSIVESQTTFPNPSSSPFRVEYFLTCFGDVLMTAMTCWCVDDCVDDCVDVLMCWWLCWRVDGLMCWWLRWSVDMLMCWWLCWPVDGLMCWWTDDCIDVLTCWCVGVFVCLCVEVLMYWCVEVLVCWCIDDSVDVCADDCVGVLMTVLMCWRADNCIDG
jgi:hypothetical protein